MESSAIKIQSWFRGCLFRLKRLPLILYQIQKHLKTLPFEFSTKTGDGRVNSSLDEQNIIDALLIRFNTQHITKIKSPSLRMWYDILVFDYCLNRWLPVNIKTTTTTTSDNTGNIAMCVYAYTDEDLNLSTTNSYQNGAMSKLLLQKLELGEYNKSPKKDYYFIIMNKRKSSDVIINSVKGLNCLAPNINNLPFQVKWDKNRHFAYDRILEKIFLFIHCINKPKPSWQEAFTARMRMLTISREN
jgi:hypothetical protein